MKQSQRIVKNIAVMIAAEIIGFSLNFVIIILIARYLGVIGFGHFSFIVAFVGVFQLIADSGLCNIMIREIAVHKDKIAYQLGVTKSLLWIFSIAAFLLIVLIINIINPEPEVRHATYIMGLSTMAIVHTQGYTSVFRAMEEMEYNAIGFVLHKIVLISLIIPVIESELGLKEIAGSFLAANSVLWIFYYIIVSRRYRRPKIIINLKAWWYFISEAIPIGIASILRKITWQVDILILSAIGTASSVGLFSAPYRIIHSANILPHTISVPLFPFFSRLARHSYHELFPAYEKSLKFMYLFSIPIVVILVTLAQSIVSILFGDKFEQSYVALQILSLTLIFLFPTAQFVYLFSALGKQRLFTIGSIICLIINVILDFILIPKFDFIGACIGTLVAEITLFGIGMYFVKLIEKNVSFIRASWKPALSGALMWVVLFQFKDASLLWILCGIFASALTYILSVILLKTFSRNELSLIKESIMFMRKTPGIPNNGTNQSQQ
jgi:O-antigen/teichoic acid export membrane protein